MCQHLLWSLHLNCSIALSDSSILPLIALLTFTHLTQIDVEDSETYLWYCWTLLVILSSKLQKYENCPQDIVTFLDKNYVNYVP